MEDKWFIFQEADTLYFHRSWTGFCRYVVHFVREENGWRATHAEVNRDPEQYSATDDERDRALLNHLIDVLLLRRQSNYPAGSDGKGSNPLAEWGFMGQAMPGGGDEGEEDPTVESS